MDKQDQMIELLREILEVLKAPQKLQDTAGMPWVYLLIHEASAGIDHDGNNLVYGVDFKFNQTVESHPNPLQPLAEKLQSSNLKAMTFLEYAKTVGQGKLQSEIVAWVKRINTI